MYDEHRVRVQLGIKEPESKEGETLGIIVCIFLIFLIWYVFSSVSEWLKGVTIPWSVWVCVIFPLLLSLSSILYLLRKHQRIYYAFTEIILGGASVLVSLIDLTDMSKVVGALGSCYVIVRGLDNRAEGRKIKLVDNYRSAIRMRLEELGMADEFGLLISGWSSNVDTNYLKAVLDALNGPKPELALKVLFPWHSNVSGDEKAPSRTLIKNPPTV